MSTTLCASSEESVVVGAVVASVGDGFVSIVVGSLSSVRVFASVDSSLALIHFDNWLVSVVEVGRNDDDNVVDVDDGGVVVSVTIVVSVVVSVVVVVVAAATVVVVVVVVELSSRFVLSEFNSASSVSNASS